MYAPFPTRTLSVTSDAWPSWASRNVLLPQRVCGTEALGKLYAYRVELAIRTKLRSAIERVKK